MSTSLTINGVAYAYPDTGDQSWGAAASAWAAAVTTGMLQKAGGTFTLTADVNFGATYGIKSKYFTTVAASPATAGVLRLAIGDTIDWGTANNALSVTSTDLYWNGSKILTVANTPSVVVENIETYIAGTALNNYTGSLTLVNMVGSYLTNGVNLYVYLNGLLCAVTLDYAETSTTSFTFGSPVNTGDRIDIRWTTY